MLDFAVFAVVFLVLIIIALVCFYPSTKRVPGLNPTSNEDGNLSDINDAGSLHEFLVDLHERFGPIASFWWGKQYTVSIASPDLFKEHQHVFDRPPLLFELYAPLMTKDSIQFANGEDGKSRRQDYDKVFAYENLSIYYDIFQKIADEIVKKWDSAGADSHLPLGEHMFLFAIKAAMVALMGDRFRNDKEILEFKHNYDMVWEEMDHRLSDSTVPSEDNLRDQNFKKAVEGLSKIMKTVIKEREEHGSKSRDFLLIDSIISHHDSWDKRYADAMTYIIGGFHTTGNLLTWCIYFLASQEDTQQRLYEEIISVLGQTDPVTHQNINQLKYLRQVLDETLRCSVVAPWAARFEDEDTMLGGHRIPKGTPVIHALGVSLMDESIWPSPLEFDPDRFSEENAKDRHTFAFSPYGFAGKRQCPGYRFAYVEASVMLVAIIRQFFVSLVPDQDVMPQYGLVTHPMEEIWVKVTKRE